MMRRVLNILFCLAAALGWDSCDRTPVVNVDTDKSALVKENMINANKVVIESESTQIESYMNRRGWKMRELPSGAFYMETLQGKGTAISPEETVEVTYKLEGLDGKNIYSHQIDTLKVGRREVTPALDDILQQLHYGSQAWMIAPSNAAYGVVGDGDRVGSRQVIVYNITNIRKI